MFRIDDASAAVALPIPETAGAEGYWTEGNPATGVPATLERASWFNMVQEELRALVVAAGLTPSKTTYNQVRQAVKRLFGGNVTTINFAASPFALTADHAGLLLVDAAAGNVVINLPAANVLAKLSYALRRVDAAATTVTINRAGADTIDEGVTSFSLLTQGDVRGLASDGASSWKTISASGSGRLIGIQIFTASGTYTPTPGTKAIKPRVQGAGGAGAGAASTSSGAFASGGNGGTAGAYAESYITSGITSTAVTVGVKGVGVAGGAGGNGGTSSFGALVSAPGGAGSSSVGNAASGSALYSGTSAVSAIATGGNLTNQSGEGGSQFFALATDTFASGRGGASRFGPGGSGRSTGDLGGARGIAGVASLNPGAGGGAAGAISANPGTFAGGNGADGIVIIEEFA